jgi:hypothetical protein
VHLVAALGLMLVFLACAEGEGPTTPVTSVPSLPSCGASPPRIRPVEVQPCPTPEEYTQLRREVSVTFVADPTRGTLVCRADQGSVDLSTIEASYLIALSFLKQLEFDRPLPWTTKSVYDWIRGTVAGIYISVGSPSRAFARDRSVFVFYPPDYAASDQPRTLESIEFEGIVHEARHTEGILHNCGDIADQRIEDMGAFGVQYSLLRWIADYSHESPETRAYALRRAWNLRSGTAFCAECTWPSVADATPDGVAHATASRIWPARPAPALGCRPDGRLFARAF